MESARLGWEGGRGLWPALCGAHWLPIQPAAPSPWDHLRALAGCRLRQGTLVQEPPLWMETGVDQDWEQAGSLRSPAKPSSLGYSLQHPLGALHPAHGRAEETSRGAEPRLSRSPRASGPEATLYSHQGQWAWLLSALVSMVTTAVLRLFPGEPPPDTWTRLAPGQDCVPGNGVLAPGTCPGLLETPEKVGCPGHAPARAWRALKTAMCSWHHHQRQRRWREEGQVRARPWCGLGPGCRCSPMAPRKLLPPCLSSPGCGLRVLREGGGW